MEEYIGTGRRKECVARVRIKRGTGIIRINGRNLDDYFTVKRNRNHAVEPLVLTNTYERFDVIAHIDGGGVSGQSGALRHGISQALCEADSELRPVMKKAGMLTRDSRMVERKKYGLRGARKRPQYSKR